MKNILLQILICLFSTVYLMAQPEAIIPKPLQMDLYDGQLNLNSKTTICFDRNNQDFKNIADYLNTQIAQATGYRFIYTNKKGTITLKLDSTVKDKEGYKLECSKKGIVITASAPNGLFYGVQTLLQLMPKEIKSLSKIESFSLFVPYCKIEDKPAFSWRGMLLDVSRHWHDKAAVMRYIDQMATLKMNVFHWHLTDDEGWRIEIKSHPELVNKGAWRAERIGRWRTRLPLQEGEKATYGGFYTQEDIKEIVAYAAKHYITILPEIDVPGHSMAALVAYPELGCESVIPPQSVAVGNRFYGKVENSLCPSNPEVYQFMKDVIAEIAPLFPCQYIHIGGDECVKNFWQQCPRCQAFMKETGLKNEEELQSYFIKQMENILKENGKQLIGWDEILEGGLAPEATVMSWRGQEGGIEAAKQGHHVIMTPNKNCYVDLYQGDPIIETASYSKCFLSDAYAFNPIPEGINPELILGGQANLWCERVPHFRQIEYMLYPRIWAISEILWYGAQNKDWNGFVKRVEAQFLRSDIAEMNYATTMYDAYTKVFLESDSSLTVEISTELPLDIYYTFDNTVPDNYALKYQQAVKIPQGATELRVITYKDGYKIGRQLIYQLADLKARAKER